MTIMLSFYNSNVYFFVEKPVMVKNEVTSDTIANTLKRVIKTIAGGELTIIEVDAAIMNIIIVTIDSIDM